MIEVINIYIYFLNKFCLINLLWQVNKKWIRWKIRERQNGQHVRRLTQLKAYKHSKDGVSHAQIGLCDENEQSKTQEDARNSYRFFQATPNIGVLKERFRYRLPHDAEETTNHTSFECEDLATRRFELFCSIHPQESES